jgi:DNA polymerase (family 10)
MDNAQFSFTFREIASLLELQKDDPFRVRAYRRAAQTIENLGESLQDIARRNALEDIPGIGQTLAREIQELLEVGSLRYHEHLKSTVPESLLPLLHLPSLSSDQVRMLWRHHDITSLPQLSQALRDERLPFETATLEAIAGDVAAWQRHQRRVLLGVALPRAETLVQNLARLPLVDRISLAGSLRRGVEMVGDINIVVASPDPPRLIHLCNRQPEVREVIDTGPTSTRLITSEGLHLSLIAVPRQHFACALLQHTGSAAHLAALQRCARQYGYVLTEHGLSRIEDGSLIPTPEEEDIYFRLSLPYIAPELREDRGEIDAAMAGRLPALVTMEDIRGDLHVHSAWGRGTHSLEDIALAAQRMGYEYVAICDYASDTASGHALSSAALAQQIDAIQQLNATLPMGVRLLAGAEVEIAPNGELQIADEILARLDIVIAAAHSGFKAPSGQPHVGQAAHPGYRPADDSGNRCRNCYVPRDQQPCPASRPPRSSRATGQESGSEFCAGIGCPYHPGHAHAAARGLDRPARLGRASAASEHAVVSPPPTATATSGRIACHLKAPNSVWAPAAGPTAIG